MKEKVTQSRLKELVEYHDDLGVFTRKVDSVSWNAKAGDIVGTLGKNGYLQTSLDGQRFYVHRLVFLYIDGYLPEGSVDHMDGCRTNNLRSNLRHVAHACNMQNQVKRTDNKTGVNGVRFRKDINKWEAKVGLSGKTICIGVHESLLEAALARFTWESWCSEWKCGDRATILTDIKNIWPEFFGG